MAYKYDNEGFMQPLPEPGITWEVPVRALINDGKMKQVQGRIFEALEDIDLSVYGKHRYMLEAGQRYYAINHDMNQPHLILRPSFTF